MAPLAMEETDDALVLRFDLPGVERSALTVETYPDRVVVHGRREARLSSPNGHPLVDEVCAGEFVREVSLPCEIDPDHTRAHYLDGVLEIHAPKCAARLGP
jgi:HSP20 family protein